MAPCFPSSLSQLTIFAYKNFQQVSQHKNGIIMSNHDENDLSFSSPTSIPADLAPPRNEDTLSDLYDPVSADFVYEGFRRLGNSIYSVTLFQSVLDKAFPDVTDYNNGRPFFTFQLNHKAPREKNMPLEAIVPTQIFTWERASPRTIPTARFLVQ